MKIFEVRSEYMEENREITEQIQYVAGDDIQQVCIHFVVECEQFERDLKSVRQVLTVVQDLRSSKTKVT